MSKTAKVVLTVLMLAAFGAALYVALRGQSTASAERAEAEAIASASELKGVIALDVLKKTGREMMNVSTASRRPA